MAKAPSYGTLSNLGPRPKVAPKKATASSMPKRGKRNNLGKYLHPKGGY